MLRAFYYEVNDISNNCKIAANYNSCAHTYMDSACEAAHDSLQFVWNR